jgi:hypothetical protein
MRAEDAREHNRYGNLGGVSPFSHLPEGVSYSTNVTPNDELAEPKADALGELGAGSAIGSRAECCE